MPSLELVDIGGGDNDAVDADIEDVPIGEPLTDVQTTISLRFQQGDLASLDTKKRKSASDLGLKALDDTYTALIHQVFGMSPGPNQLGRHGFPTYATMIAHQKRTIELARRQRTIEPELHEV